VNVGADRSPLGAIVDNDIRVVESALAELALTVGDEDNMADNLAVLLSLDESVESTCDLDTEDVARIYAVLVARSVERQRDEDRRACREAARRTWLRAEQAERAGRGAGTAPWVVQEWERLAVPGHPAAIAPRESDPRVRAVIDDHAMKVARDRYSAEGYVVTDVSAFCAYDLECTKGDAEPTVRVEVKGTRGDGDVVTVTRGEVENAHGAGWRTDLCIIRGITVEHRGAELVAIGGEIRIIRDWRPAAVDLVATQYRYLVPSECAGPQS
jgi:hypothetical protein